MTSSNSIPAAPALVTVITKLSCVFRFLTHTRMHKPAIGIPPYSCSFKELFQDSCGYVRYFEGFFFFKILFLWNEPVTQKLV